MNLNVKFQTTQVTNQLYDMLLASFMRATLIDGHASSRNTWSLSLSRSQALYLILVYYTPYLLDLTHSGISIPDPLPKTRPLYEHTYSKTICALFWLSSVRITHQLIFEVYRQNTANPP